MAEKIFALCVAVMLMIHGAAFAKKKAPEIPLSERTRIAVEVVDDTNFTDLDTAEILRDVLISQLNEKNLYNVVSVGGGLEEIKTLGEKTGAADVGDLLVFSPEKSFVFDRGYYKNLGAQYVIRCEILGLGIAKGDPDTFDISPGIGVGLETDESLGVGIGIFGGAASSLRNFYNVAVNMNLIEVESSKIVLRQNLTGRVIQHKKPRKGYDNASDEAYLKAIKKTAEVVTKRVGDYFKQENKK
ncbi:MAG: hypothetical protein J5809_04190 [Selenomonadaceae bacterium]|nr:hypothetical protein [Selenomonadaceae bacterium]